MFETSTIELSRSAFRNNIRFVRKQAGGQTLVSFVIKGNAYGHGIHAMVPLAEEAGVRHFSVFSAAEALRAHEAAGPESDIVVMGAMQDDAVHWAVEQGVAFWVFGRPRLRDAIAAARKVGRPARVHLEIETGMNRTGLPEEAIAEVIQLIQANREHLVIEGLCTHFAGAESINNFVRIEEQKRVYAQTLEQFQVAGIHPRHRHVASSAGTINYPECRYDLVRVGILLYGFWPSRETRMHWLLEEERNGGAGPHRAPEPTPEPTSSDTLEPVGDGREKEARIRAREARRRKPDPLRRVLRWTSRVMNLKKVPAGEFVSYGTAYMTTQDQRIATVPVGYADGFARGLSNLGQVLIRGRRAQVIGMVNMNMILVDVTRIPGCAQGDQVVLIGRQKKQEITVQAFSDMVRLIDYETLVGLPESIPRVVVD